ncbi:MAG: redoxin domain-containing protein [Pseudomonadales bacterium]|nr:peroxiredoxin [Pseudomonadales bacterium]NIX07066.1 redoxin domain-containing protein [Pseudomonadales bacterium]
MLRKGDQAPDFELSDQTGQPVKLSGLLRNGPVVLYFYPADFTPVCTREACAFRDRHEDLSNLDVAIVGISPQNQASHRRFAETYGVPFPLLCDTDKTVIRAYGVDGPLGLGVRRVTYLIDRERTITNRAVSDIFLGSHLALIEEVLSQP